MRAAYVDASALVKLFKPERESVALVEALSSWPLRISSELLAVESRCTARRLGGGGDLVRAERALAHVDLTPCSRAIQERAGQAFDVPLTALDAIHAATALMLGESVGAVFVYDSDLTAALAAEGMTVAAPGSR